MTLGGGTGIKLTPREREVLRAVCAGHTSKEIGLELGIRPHTVEAYVDHVRMKLGAANRCHMVALAVGRGLCADGEDTDH